VGKGVHPVTIGFMKFRPDMLKSYDEFEELAIPTPRSVGEFTGRILDAVDAVNFKTDDLVLPVLSGLVGQRVGAEFVAFRDRFLKCPMPEDILMHPATAKVPAEVDVVFATGCALIAHIAKADANGKSRVTDRTTLDRAVTYLTRLPADMTNGLLRSLFDKGAKGLVSIPNYQKWAARNGDILGRE
jgi:hypothetical protein